MTEITPAHFAALVLARLSTLVALLATKGWPEISPWWSETFTRFMCRLVRQLVARVGRRGGKSSTACVFAVAFALVFSTLGLVPPGDTGWVVIVSVRREEALSRLATIQAILRAIGVKFTPADGDAIILHGTNIGFRVQAATVAAVTGWTSILIIADEVSKWSEDKSGSNPATEVLASLRPTMATQPLGRILLISSAFGTEDAHAKAFDLGDTEFQIVAFAETWVANPTITEDDTHKLEPDEKLHAREYGGIPGAIASDAFRADLVRAAIRTGGPLVPHPPPLLLIDASAGKGDSFCWGLAQRFRRADGRECIRIAAMLGFDDEFRKHWTWDRAIDYLAARAKAMVDVRRGVSDGYLDFALGSALQKHGIEHVTLNWTAESKVDAVALVRRWLRDDVLYVEPGPDAEKWRAEMIAFREKLMPSGLTSFGARNGGHDDRVALLLNLAMADIKGLFSRDVAPLRLPPPVMMSAGAAGFEGLNSPMVITGADQLRATPQRPIDDIVEETLRADARTAASADDNVRPGYAILPYGDHDITEGF